MKFMLKDEGSIIGTITPEVNLTGYMTPEVILIGNITPIINLTASVDILTSVPDYTGSYFVVPEIEQVMIETSQKKMNDNVVVDRIPYFEVSNQSGGNTVIIGGLTNGN